MTTQRNTETTPATATPEAPAPATVPGTVLCDLEKRMAGEYQAKAYRTSCCARSAAGASGRPTPRPYAPPPPPSGSAPR